MQTGDIIFYRDTKFGHHRFYEVQGVFLGGVGQESLVELKSLTEKPGLVTADGVLMPTSFVPEPLLRSWTVYRRTLL